MNTSPQNLCLHAENPEHNTVAPISAEQVTQYLQAHPDFLLTHEHLLPLLHLPQTKDGTLSLVSRQSELMRDKLSKLEQALLDLHTEAHANEYRSLHLHRLAVHLLGSTCPCMLLESLRSHLCQNFDLVAALLYLDEQTTTAQAIQQICPQLDFENNVGSALALAWQSLNAINAPHIPRNNNELRQILRRHKLPETASTAVIPIDSHEKGADNSRERLGTLLLVKSTPQGFSADMGKLFLHQVGELLAVSLKRITLPNMTACA
ncbi:MAG: DUF484 family protein [Halothiobacillaceae bacterium]